MLAKCLGRNLQMRKSIIVYLFVGSYIVKAPDHSLNLPMDGSDRCASALTRIRAARRTSG